MARYLACALGLVVHDPKCNTCRPTATTTRVVNLPRLHSLLRSKVPCRQFGVVGGVPRLWTCVPTWWQPSGRRSWLLFQHPGFTELLWL
eukprot:3996275-Amphidinium_carterae.1